QPIGSPITALNHWDDEFIAKQLENKRLEIENVIKAEQEKLSKRRIVPDYYAEGQLWKEMSAFADKNNIPVSNDTFTIYHDMDYREKDV
ncbi:MerR family transcriptional regulator, partial [Clostridioides difficile]|nr:MerR family transcriptional regulator [Clostridioides difficile]